MNKNDFMELTSQWFIESCKLNYSYHFTWLGRPIIQYPQDIMALQEIIWQVQPDLIIETGIAHGGSLIFYASMLELIGNEGLVIGIDIDIREQNRLEIEKNRMFKRIRMLQGSSLDQDILNTVKQMSKDRAKVMIVLDSNHTHEHVLQEMEAYSPLVTKESYLVVMDTVVEDMPEDFYFDRPWGIGNNPKTAVREFLKTSDRFVIDREIEKKLVITVAPEGYLKCIRD